jgi:DNA-binding GntR family transcriptional regulator
MAKLRQQDADVIRRLYAAGDIRQSALARQFGVSRGTIRNILSGRRWEPEAVR